MINAKKLNAYLSNTSTPSEMISLVKTCVENILNNENASQAQREFLKDLGLLKNVKTTINS